MIKSHKYFVNSVFLSPSKLFLFKSVKFKTIMRYSIWIDINDDMNESLLFTHKHTLEEE